MPFDLNVFLNRYTWVTLLYILTQQALVASGTYFLTQLMQAFQANEPFEFMAICLLPSHAYSLRAWMPWTSQPATLD
jgi:hypothetical protein